MTDSPSDISLDAAARSAVLARLLSELDRYVDHTIADQIKAAVRSRQQQGGYDDLTRPGQFADTLNAQLQAHSQDTHLRVHFSPTPLPQIDPSSVDPAVLAPEQAQSQQRSFDINRVERLAGNVGYLQLFGFEPPAFAGSALAAAMTLVAHTNALIVDLRQNQGGSPEMVALLCSYLLPAYPLVHLTTLSWPQEQRTQQFWTSAHTPAPRYLDRPVYVLCGAETASAAEEFAYSLQSLKRIVLVGETTAGTANPGRGYRLGDHFWMFVPTGQITSALTGENWHKTGVVPDFKVPAELALAAGHLLALKQLERTQKGPQREIQSVIPRVEKQLDQMQHDLVGQMSGLR